MLVVTVINIQSEHGSREISLLESTSFRDLSSILTPQVNKKKESKIAHTPATPELARWRQENSWSSQANHFSLFGNSRLLNGSVSQIGGLYLGKIKWGCPLSPISAFTHSTHTYRKLTVYYALLDPSYCFQEKNICTYWEFEYQGCFIF